MVQGLGCCSHRLSQGWGHSVKEGHGAATRQGSCVLSFLYTNLPPLFLSLSTFSRAQVCEQRLSIISTRCRVGSALHTEGIGWCRVDVVPCGGCVWGCSVGQHPLLAETSSPVALSLIVSVLLRCCRPAGLVAWERVHTNPTLLLPAPSFGRGEAEPLLPNAVFLFVFFLSFVFSFLLEIKSERKEESQPFSYSFPPPPH